MEINNIQQLKRYIHKAIKEKDAYERRFLLDSPIEEILFDELRFLGHMPETQIPVGPYFIDMGYPKKKIGVECLGENWHKTQKQIEYDNERNEFLREQGWEIMYFDGSNIYKNPEPIADEIVNKVFGKSRGIMIDEAPFPNEYNIKHKQRLFLKGEFPDIYEDEECGGDWLEYAGSLNEIEWK